MIKVTVGEQKPQSQKPFPKLMKSDDIIVLFYEASKGTVLSENDVWSLGHHSTSWDIEQFSDYEGTITLKNA